MLRIETSFLIKHFKMNTHRALPAENRTDNHSEIREKNFQPGSESDGKRPERSAIDRPNADGLRAAGSEGEAPGDARRTPSEPTGTDPARWRSAAGPRRPAQPAGYVSGAPGPMGRPRAIHAPISTIHPIMKTTVYGSIVAMTVPIPAFLSYRSKKATMRAK